MHTSNDFVREIRALFPSAGSDYGLAKILNVSQQAISKRKKEGSIFSDKTGERIAQLTGHPLEYVLSCLDAERAKCPTIKAARERIAGMFAQSGKKAARVAMTLIGLLLLPFLTGQSDATAASVTVRQAHEFDTVYIMRRRRHVTARTLSTRRRLSHLYIAVLAWCKHIHAPRLALAM